VIRLSLDPTRRRWRRGDGRRVAGREIVSAPARPRRWRRSATMRRAVTSPHRGLPIGFSRRRKSDRQLGQSQCGPWLSSFCPSLRSSVSNSLSFLAAVPPVIQKGSDASPRILPCRSHPLRSVPPKFQGRAIFGAPLSSLACRRNSHSSRRSPLVVCTTIIDHLPRSAPAWERTRVVGWRHHSALTTIRGICHDWQAGAVPL